MPVRANYLLVGIAVIAFSGCSINDDLRDFQTRVPEKIAGLEWLELVPLGAFASVGPVEPATDARSLAQRAADLRRRAAAIRGPVLDPARARAMRAALRRLARR